MNFFNSFTKHFTFGMLPWTVAGWIFLAKPGWVGYMYFIIAFLCTVHAWTTAKKELNEGPKS